MAIRDRILVWNLTRTRLAFEGVFLEPNPEAAGLSSSVPDPQRHNHAKYFDFRTIRTRKGNEFHDWLRSFLRSVLGRKLAVAGVPLDNNTSKYLRLTAAQFISHVNEKGFSLEVPQGPVSVHGDVSPSVSPSAEASPPKNVNASVTGDTPQIAASTPLKNPNLFEALFASTSVEPAGKSAAEPSTEPTVEAAVEPAAEPVSEPAVEPVGEPTVEPAAEPAVEEGNKVVDLAPFSVIGWDTLKTDPSSLTMDVLRGWGALFDPPVKGTSKTGLASEILVRGEQLGLGGDTAQG